MGLKGVAADEPAAREVEKLVLSTLEEIVAVGFDDETVASAMNTVEFRLREFNTGGFPKGLSLMLATLNEWNYARDPLAPLRFEAPLKQLKEKLARGEPVFQDLIQQLLLDNPSRATVRLVPNVALEKELEASEAAKLTQVRQKLTEQELTELEEDTAAQKARQAAKDDAADLAKIPSLRLGDLEKKSVAIPLEVRDGGDGATVLRHALPTAGVLYVDVALELSRLSLEQVNPLESLPTPSPYPPYPLPLPSPSTPRTHPLPTP